MDCCVVDSRRTSGGPATDGEFCTVAMESEACTSNANHRLKQPLPQNYVKSAPLSENTSLVGHPGTHADGYER